MFLILSLTGYLFLQKDFIKLEQNHRALDTHKNNDYTNDIRSRMQNTEKIENRETTESRKNSFPKK